jgi:hypothetical protein
VTKKIDAKTKTIAWRRVDGTGPGSTQMKMDKSINAMEAMMRQAERCAPTALTKLVVFPLKLRIVYRIIAKMMDATLK